MVNPDFALALRKVAVLRSASDQDIQAIAALGVLRGVEEGSYFFMQGDPANYLYVMFSGQAKLCQINPDGQQVNLRTLVPHQLFGAIGAIDPEAVYPACAQALRDSTALAIESARFRALIQEHPNISFGMMKLMTGYIQEIQERYRELATERVEQRIARALLRLAVQSGRKMELGVEIELIFSRQDLAEMTGTTLYTVSRTLSAWEKRGLIATGRERVIIRNPHGLVRLADDLDK